MCKVKKLSSSVEEDPVPSSPAAERTQHILMVKDSGLVSDEAYHDGTFRGYQTHDTPHKCHQRRKEEAE